MGGRIESGNKSVKPSNSTRFKGFSRPRAGEHRFDEIRADEMSVLQAITLNSKLCGMALRSRIRLRAELPSDMIGWPIHGASAGAGARKD
jgi:hypothetical protein